MLDPEAYVQLLVSTLKKGSVLRLKGEMPFQSGEVNHYFVILNYDAASSEYLVAVNNTSQVVSRLFYLSGQDGVNVRDTTVVFEPGQYGFFPRQTLFDCNSLHEITQAELVSAYTLGNLSIPSDSVKLTEVDLGMITQGVLQSKSVSPVNKRLIDPGYQPPARPSAQTTS